MGFFFINARRRAAMNRDSSIFEDVERGNYDEKPTMKPQKVTPSFKGEPKKPSIKKVISEKKQTAEKRYLEALAKGNHSEEKRNYRQLQEARRAEKNYNRIKKENLDRKLAPIKSGLKAISDFGSNLRKRSRARREAFGGFGQQSDIQFGDEVNNSPFRR